MTLRKSFDLVLIGHSLSSYILGLDALDRDKTVLIVDDNQHERLFSTFYLNGLEKLFLQKWGETRNIYPLVNLDDYLISPTLHFYADDQQLILGNQVIKRNVQEVLRKLNITVSEQSFENINDELKLLVNEIIWHLVENQLSEKRMHEILQTKCPEVKKILQVVWTEQLFWDAKKSFMIQSSYWFFTQEGAEDNYLHRLLLFLNWCLPYYQIKNDKLFSDLKQTFYVKGGDLREAQVLEWQYDGRKPWCLGLSSYEGVVHPQKVIWGRPRWPVGADCYGEIYGNITSGLIKDALPLGISLFTQEQSIRGVFPLIVLDKNPVSVSYRMLLKRGAGAKESFYTSQVIEYLTRTFKQYFYVDIDLNSSDFSAFFGQQSYFASPHASYSREEKNTIFDLYHYQYGLGGLESYLLAKDYLYDRKTLN